MPLRILAPTRYPWFFNGPHQSAHVIERRDFIPFNKIWPRFEGLTVFNPWPPRHFDLIHAFNRIPLSRLPFVIGFESHLPRAFGAEGTAYFRWASGILAGPRCKQIVAISEHARRIFLATHAGSSFAGALSAKLTTHYPNIDIPDVVDIMTEVPLEPVRVSFVGNHFGRKGGCVAVRLAQIALERKFPLEVTIGSALEVGAGVWTDPLRTSFFEPYFALLGLPNVEHLPSMPNRDVLELFRQSHFSLLTTFSDTFGFSALESMANWTPVIGTRQSALPEFIRHGENGVLLDLPVNDSGDWIYSASKDRDKSAFERIYREEVERLARESFEAIVSIVSAPQKLAAMRRAARETMLRMFDAQKANAYWDDVYRQSVDSGGSEFREEI